MRPDTAPPLPAHRPPPATWLRGCNAIQNRLGRVPHGAAPGLPPTPCAGRGRSREGSWGDLQPGGCHLTAATVPPLDALGRMVRVSHIAVRVIVNIAHGDRRSLGEGHGLLVAVNRLPVQ